MDIPELNLDLINALEKLDSEILPLGLYASDELVEGKKNKPRYQEWPNAIFPLLQSQNYLSSGFSTVNSSVSQSYFYKEGNSINLNLVKFSGIKVRRYGSSCHVDKHEDRKGNW